MELFLLNVICLSACVHTCGHIYHKIHSLLCFLFYELLFSLEILSKTQLYNGKISRKFEKYLYYTRRLLGLGGVHKVGMYSNPSSESCWANAQPHLVWECPRGQWCQWSHIEWSRILGPIFLHLYSDSSWHVPLNILMITEKDSNYHLSTGLNVKPQDLNFIPYVCKLACQMAGQLIIFARCRNIFSP